MKVLLVDDNKTITGLVTEFLQEKGVKIEVANDPRKGLQLIRDRKYDYVFLDNHMPGLYGVDIINKLEDEKILKNQKIIIFSGDDFSSKDLDELRNKEGSNEGKHVLPADRACRDPLGR